MVQELVLQKWNLNKYDDVFAIFCICLFFVCFCFCFVLLSSPVATATATATRTTITTNGVRITAHCHLNI